MFVRDDVSAECIGSFDNGVCELLVLKIHSLNTVLAIIYRPPDTRLSEFSPALTELNKLLTDLPAPAPNLVLMGDLNFPSTVMNRMSVDGLLVPSVHGHRLEGAEDGQQARLQASRLCDMATSHHMVQLVGNPTHGKEILDLVFTSDPHFVSHIGLEPFPVFTDHSVLSIMVNCKLETTPNKEQMFILDSARRLNKLDFSKAPWLDIKKRLKSVDWSPLSRLASVNPTLAHSWFLQQILPILENLVPVKKIGKGRSKLHRKRKLIWRKIRKINARIQTATSSQRVLRLLQDKQDLETELKAMYTT